MSQTLNKIINEYPEDEFLTVEGFSEAVVGVDLDARRLIYSASRCIDILVYEDNMILEEAVEYFEEVVRKTFPEGEGPIWANIEI